MFPAGKKYCSNQACQRKGVLEWQREHKRGYDKASGQDIKKKERREQAKKYAFIACVLLQATSRQIYALTIAEASRKNYSSA